MSRDNSEQRKRNNSAHLTYIWLVGSVFIIFTIVFLFFPRTKYSELEKRDLAEFPDVTDYRGRLSQLTADISTWFSDSEPFRDRFMTMSMGFRDAIGFTPGDPGEKISFKPSDTPLASPDADADLENIPEAVGNPLAEANAKTSNSGTIVVGSGDNVRALMAYGASPQAGARFVDMASEFARELPGVNLYALIAPLATEFYLPEKASGLSKPQKPVLDYIRDHLPAGVTFVDVYPRLAAHTDEPIYLRTDHHWAPLGAYYAAQAFARAAGVPFRDLDSYEAHTIRNFVGSMYGYTKDIAVKNAPEDFVYYTPKGLDYKTTYVTYHTNKDYRISSETKPYAGKFFHTFKDGSGNAYLTFMGGDQHLVKVETGTPSRRKLLIIKDSYGNPIPGYLFYSFGEVHVIDFRYFPHNLKKYIHENGITDILFAFNTFNAVSSVNMSRTAKLLNHAGGFAPPATEPEKAASPQPVVETSKAVETPKPQEEEPTPEPETTPSGQDPVSEDEP